MKHISRRYAILIFICIIAISFCAARILHKQKVKFLYPAYVVNNNEKKWGYIDSKGKFIIKPQFTESGEFSYKGFANVSDNKGSYTIDINGNRHKQVMNSQNGEGETDDKYKVTTNEQPDETKYIFHGEELFDVSTRYGIKDKKGRFIFKPIYPYIKYIGEDRFLVSKKAVLRYSDNAFYIKKALMDRNGHILTGYNYFDVGTFKNGVCSVCDGTKTYFINRNGKRIKSLPVVQGDGILTLEPGNIIKAEVDWRLQYINKRGKAIWKEKNKTKHFKNGIIVKENKKRFGRETVIYYPQVLHMKDRNLQEKINKKLNEAFVKERINNHINNDDEKCKVNEVVQYKLEMIGDILSIKSTDMLQFVDAANGDAKIKCINISLKDGNEYTLRDLFYKKKEFNKLATKAVNHQIDILNRSYKMYYNIHSLKAENPQILFVKSGVKFVFRSNVAVCNAYGTPEVLVPYKKISHIINEKSMFWQEINKK